MVEINNTLIALRIMRQKCLAQDHAVFTRLCLLCKKYPVVVSQELLFNFLLFKFKCFHHSKLIEFINETIWL